MRKPIRNSVIHTPLRQRIPDPLAKLRADLDRLVESMQTPAHKAACDALFAATGTELGAFAAPHARDRAAMETKKLRGALRGIDTSIPRERDTARQDGPMPRSGSPSTKTTRW